MTERNIYQELRDIISRFVERPISPESVTLETRLRDDLDVSSLHYVDMLCAVEESFGIAIADDEAADLDTVGAWVRLIASKVDEKTNEAT